MDIKDMMGKYCELEEEIHERFGFGGCWRVFPMDSLLDRYWFLTPDEERICYSPEPFTKEGVEKGEAIYGGEVYHQRHLHDGVWHADGCTMVLVDTQCDLNVLLMVFDDDRRLTDPELIELYEECW